MTTGKIVCPSGTNSIEALFRENKFGYVTAFRE
jgi:hypothetical protein